MAIREGFLEAVGLAEASGMQGGPGRRAGCAGQRDCRRRQGRAGALSRRPSGELGSAPTDAARTHGGLGGR